MPLLIAYPVINPIWFEIGPFPIRWYALAYVAGLILGWVYARHLVARDRLWGGVPRPSVASIDDLLIYMALGVILGGRICYVLLYDPALYIADPIQIFVLWKGGMAFHGGLAGSVLAIYIFARRHHIGFASVLDIAAAATPIGLFLGRIANFIKPELWGRTCTLPCDVPWAMVFPGGGLLPRHPSQLYEAGLEGIALFLILALAIRFGALRRPGFVSGIFAIGYGLARIAVEFFREPDRQLGYLFGSSWLTMGMLLSLPLLAAGLALLRFAWLHRGRSETLEALSSGTKTSGTKTSGTKTSATKTSATKTSETKTSATEL
jgi:phosphatidylglycerol:prolipoprotein diacylglycerol transferase